MHAALFLTSMPRQDPPPAHLKPPTPPPPFGRGGDFLGGGGEGAGSGTGSTPAGSRTALSTFTDEMPVGMDAVTNAGGSRVAPVLETCWLLPWPATEICGRWGW